MVFLLLSFSDVPFCFPTVFRPARRRRVHHCCFRYCFFFLFSTPFFFLPRSWSCRRFRRNAGVVVGRARYDGLRRGSRGWRENVDRCERTCGAVPATYLYAHADNGQRRRLVYGAMSVWCFENKRYKRYIVSFFTYRCLGAAVQYPAAAATARFVDFL